MAFLKDITFIGTIGDFTAYKMKGYDKIILRRKGGPRKGEVNTSPTYALNRLHRKEFGASATLGKFIRFMLGTHQAVSNYNISGKINSILKHLKHQDKEGKLGERALRLSSLPRLLQGFPLNIHNTFDTILRTTVQWSITRETRSARIEVPALMRGINFQPLNQQPYFCITVVLGIVPDVLYNEASGAYGPSAWFDGMYIPTQASSPWYPAKKGAPVTTLEVAADIIPPDESYTLLLSIGVRFASLDDYEKIQLLDNLGAAKILGTM
jgi:hypothetical protein